MRYLFFYLFPSTFCYQQWLQTAPIRQFFFKNCATLSLEKNWGNFTNIIIMKSVFLHCRRASCWEECPSACTCSCKQAAGWSASPASVWLLPTCPVAHNSPPAQTRHRTRENWDFKSSDKTTNEEWNADTVSNSVQLNEYWYQFQIWHLTIAEIPQSRIEKIP